MREKQLKCSPKSWHERGREIGKYRKREHHKGRQKKQMNIKDTKRALVERKIELKRKRLIKNDNAQK